MIEFLNTQLLYTPMWLWLITALIWGVVIGMKRG